MLRIRNVEEIEELLQILPALVRKQERKSPDFSAAVETWLDSLEKAFESNGLYQAGNISVVKSTIIAVKEGHIPDGVEVRGRPSRSRILKIVASQAMQQGANVATRVIEENRSRIDEATRVAQQIVAAAVSRGEVTARGEGIDNTSYMRAIRQGLAASSDLETAAVHLEGLVGPQDALVLLDRALTPQLKHATPANTSSIR